MKIVIIEDEAMVARRILRMTQSFFGDSLKSLNHFDNVAQGVMFLKDHQADLLLLDLNLNGQDGFEVLKQLSSASFHTVVVSAHKDQAITAFEYGVLDFVPKPFSEERLAQAFLRITQRHENRAMRFLSVQKRGTQQLIKVKDICYIQGARVYTELYLIDGRKEVHNKSLDKLETLLPANFERVHKSYLVDMSRVSELQVSGGGKYNLLMKDGAILPVSRSKYKELKNKWFA
ncbi:MAG: LytTR family DNA-binding domain-containing protein [Bacteroidota bacterium]